MNFRRSFKSYFLGVKIAPYLYYLLFLSLFWVIHLICISVVSSIHFSLGHGLKITEDWIFSKAWLFISLSTLTSFLFVYKIFSLESLTSPLKELLQFQEWGHYKKRSFVLILYLYFALFFLGGHIELSHVAFELPSFLLSFFGMALLLTLNFFLLSFLVVEFFKGLALQKIIFLLITFLLYIFCFESTTLYKIHQVDIFYLLSFSLLGLLLGEKYQWNIGVYLIIFFLLPTVSLLGFDPIYGGDNSPFLLTKTVMPEQLLFTIMVGTGYIYSERVKKILLP